MRAPVVVQLGAGHEQLPAHITDEPLHASVDLFMLSDRTQLQEALVADAAGVRPVAAVDAAMGRQV